MKLKMMLLVPNVQSFNMKFIDIFSIIIEISKPLFEF